MILHHPSYGIYVWSFHDSEEIGPRMLARNAPGKGAYPIASFTWLLVLMRSKDAAKGKILKDFLSWMLDSGEPMTAQLTDAPLPTAVSKDGGRGNSANPLALEERLC